LEKEKRKGPKNLGRSFVKKQRPSAREDSKSKEEKKKDTPRETARKRKKATDS